MHRSAKLHDIIPDAQRLLALTPERLALDLLTVLRDPENEQYTSKRNAIHSDNIAEDYPKFLRPQIMERLVLAWNWLEREGLLTPKMTLSGDWYRLSERGIGLKTEADLEQYLDASNSPSSRIVVQPSTPAPTPSLSVAARTSNMDSNQDITEAAAVDDGTTYEYDVALSYAGENRDYVEAVASILKQNGMKVFYDKDEDIEIQLWGKDLGDELDRIYRLASEYVVIFISEPYAMKMWTNHERKSALAKALELKREYVLPARFDDAVLDGLRPTVRFVDLRKQPPESFAQMIMRKVRETKSSSLANVPAQDNTSSTSKLEDLLGYMIFGFEDKQMYDIWSLFGDTPPSDIGQEGKGFEPVYFDNYGEMADVFSTLSKIIDKAKDETAPGGDTSQVLLDLLQDEVIERASYYVAEGTMPAPPVPQPEDGFRYVIWGAGSGVASMIRAMRLHEALGSSKSENQPAKRNHELEVYFNNVEMVLQIPAALQQASELAAGEPKEYRRQLFKAVARLKSK